MKLSILKLTFIFLICLAYKNSYSCQCPISELTMEHISKYELIFKGKITSIKLNKERSEAIFFIQELYKGNTWQEFKVLFNDEDPCKQELRVGDEWIIYTSYFQVGNAKLDFCSRSRKFFKQDKEDFVNATTGVTYSDETIFLQTKLGLHKLLKQNPTNVENRNILPSDNEKVLAVIISILFIIAFYWVFNRLVK